VFVINLGLHGAEEWVTEDGVLKHKAEEFEEDHRAKEQPSRRTSHD
jgi:hypothetical protein